MTDAMKALTIEDEMYAWVFGGKRYDIGTMRDWFRSHIELSSQSEFADILNEVLEVI